MHNFNNELLDFLNKGTCTFTSTLEIKKILDNNNYQELQENTDWNSQV